MEDIFLLIILSIVGLGIGSFLNSVAIRLDEVSSLVKGRSLCPHCRHQLAWYDLIPLVSFIMLSAKCRYCRKKISWIYPLGEILTALVFILLFLKFGLTWQFAVYALANSFLIVILIYDLLTLAIADFLVYITLAILIGACFFNKEFLPVLIDRAWGILIVAAIPTILVVISKEKWMGRGDIEVAALIGLLVGKDLAFLSVTLTFLLGGIIGIILLALKKAKISDKVAFAPFLIAGGWITFFAGEKILSWYLNLIF